VKANRKICDEEVYVAAYLLPVVPFSETVLFREPRPDHRRLTGAARQRKAESQWERGIWLGRSDEANDHLIGTAGSTI
jgi:hypothetical protein